MGNGLICNCREQVPDCFAIFDIRLDAFIEITKVVQLAAMILKLMRREARYNRPYQAHQLNGLRVIR